MTTKPAQRTLIAFTLYYVGYARTANVYLSWWKDEMIHLAFILMAIANKHIVDAIFVLHVTHIWAVIMVVLNILHYCLWTLESYWILLEFHTMWYFNGRIISTLCCVVYLQETSYEAAMPKMNSSLVKSLIFPISSSLYK